MKEGILSMQSLKSYRWVDLPLNLAVLGIYLGIAKLSLVFSITSSGVTIFWPAGGFALALLLLAGPKYLPGVFGGALTAAIIIGGSPTFAVLSALGNVLETVCAYWLLTYYRPINLSLERYQDFFKLLFYGASLSALISAAIGSLTLLALKLIEPSLWPSIALRWWMADAIGIAFMTPLILLWGQSRKQLEKQLSLEIIALFSLTFLMGQSLVFHWFVAQFLLEFSIAWILPFIIWAGLRAGRQYTALLLCMIFLQALWGASHGIGQYANDMQESGMVNFWVFGMLTAVGGMLLAIINSYKSKQVKLREESRGNVLELIANDKPLVIILEEIVRNIEQENPAMLCSILLLDDTGHHLLNGVAPSLPDFYNTAIDGIEIGMGVGSCGTAAFTNRRVIVEDIQHHPYWVSYKALAAKAELGACWSEPIQSKQGQVLGTFAIYHRNTYQPTAANFSLIGQTAYLASIAIEQNKKDLALKSSELRFRQLFQSIPSVAVQGYDSEGNTCYWNKASEKLYGYSADEAIGQSLFDLIVPPAMLAGAREKMQQVFESRNPTPPSEFTLMAKDGREVNVMSSHAYIHVPGQSAEMFCIDVDLTERKQAEEAIKLSRDQFGAIFNQSPIGIGVIDSFTGSIYKVNQKYTEIMGRSSQELTNIDWMSITHPDDLQEDLDNMDLMNAGEISGYTIDKRLMRSNGSYVWVNMRISPLKQEEGASLRHLCMISDISERKKLEEALQIDREFYQAITDNGMALIWMSGLDKGCFYFNRPWLEFTGRSLEQELGNGWAEGVHSDDFDRCLAIYLTAFDKQEKFSMVYRLRRYDGEYRWIIDNGMPRYGSDGEFIGYVGHCLDITKSKQAEEKLKLAANVFTHAREGIAITDAEGAIIDVNDTFTHTTGYSREEVIGKNSRILQSGRQSSEFYADMWKCLLEDGYWVGEVWNRRKNGEVYAEMKTISAVRDAQGITTHYVALCTDITPMKEHQEQLEHIAHYDVLTSLPNRSLLADRLTQTMLQCQRRHQSLAVVFLDLDGFKAVNDKQGHDAGDELLIIISQRMKEALREGDTLARFGGDEFVAVLADLVKVEDCEPVLERLLLAASEPVLVGESVLQVSASVGVTIYPQDGAEADQLMRHADQAMYVAKQAGKNQYHLFDTAQDDVVKIQRENIGDIRSALDRREFELYYQPKVNMHTGEVVGVEALIRWQHPVRGLRSPLEFLPVIEDHDISLEVGEWVIDTALTQIGYWRTEGLHFSISVNISAYQLQQTDFSHRLAALLAAHPETPPECLELEVLETSGLSDIGHVSSIMHACRDLGVHFALDDFGTGYSSLTYLRHLPVSLIKIDQSFVRDMLVDPEDLAIVKGVVGLAKSFNREVIAEGVETIEHGTALLQLGCELAQGFGIARPMPANEIPAWVASWKADEIAGDFRSK